MKQSKQAEAKQKQGFRKDSPNCANCIHFKCDVKQEVTKYGTYTKETNLRCSLGNFKVGKSNYCPVHYYADNG